MTLFRDKEEREQLERLLREILHVLERLNRKIPDRYQIHITQETPMAIGNIPAGSSGQLGAQLLLNGSSYVVPSDDSYVFTPTFTADDPSVTFTAATTDESGGTLPLADQIVLDVPAGDTGTSVTVTVTAADPNGNTLSATLTIPLTPEGQTFTISLTQLA